jgi:uncharacterized coiled-coil protein SlyX
LLNTTGSFNTANGALALLNNTTGGNNTAIGAGALFSNNANFNTGVGSQALFNNTGRQNTAIGGSALENNTTGHDNIALGVASAANVTTAVNVITIGNFLPGANVDYSCYIDNIDGRPGGSQAVYVNGSGRLGQLVSSARFKEEIKSIEQSSEAIYGLRPVSFRYKPEIEPARPLAFGLIAEEVEQVNPDLVARDKEGKPFSVRYEAVNAMLLNEFLKEHRKVEAQQATIGRLETTAAKQEATITQLKQDFQLKLAEQQRQIKALTSGLEKVNNQLELNKPAPQIVDNQR